MHKKWYGKDFRLGVLGGGQLGRMLIQEAVNYDVYVHCLDPDAQAPCVDLAHSFTIGSLTDFDTVYNFGKDKDVLTVEIEHVNIEGFSAAAHFENGSRQRFAKTILRSQQYSNSSISFS
jgi:5-(carboxyamino)imidazole ribonucleotide synthase